MHWKKDPQSLHCCQDVINLWQRCYKLLGCTRLLSPCLIYFHLSYWFPPFPRSNFLQPLGEQGSLRRVCVQVRRAKTTSYIFPQKKKWENNLVFCAWMKVFFSLKLLTTDSGWWKPGLHYILFYRGYCQWRNRFLCLMVLSLCDNNIGTKCLEGRSQNKPSLPDIKARYLPLMIQREHMLHIVLHVIKASTFYRLSVGIWKKTHQITKLGFQQLHKQVVV